MPTIKLTFCGPVKMEEFRKDYPENAMGPGIYIWGFIRQEKFYPYYVGKAQKSVTTRTQSHFKNLTKRDSTYMRLTKEYMEGTDSIIPYYIDGKFPLFPKRSNYFNENKDYFQERIYYLNNKAFLSSRGIDIQNNLLCNADDYIHDNIKSLYVIYACCDQDTEGNRIEESFYGMMEAYVKFSLKGITISESSYIKDNCPINFEIYTKFLENGIDMDIFKTSPSCDFPGYSHIQS